MFSTVDLNDIGKTAANTCGITARGGIPPGNHCAITLKRSKSMFGAEYLANIDKLATNTSGITAPVLISPGNNGSITLKRSKSPGINYLTGALGGGNTRVIGSGYERQANRFKLISLH